MSDNRNDNIENDAIVSVETTDENVAEEQTAQEVSAQGILYEYSVKHAAALAKKEKRKGVMQFIKYALCAASAGIIQIVLFTILQAVLPKDMGNIHFIVEDMPLGTVPRAMILAFLFYMPFYPFQTWYVHTIKSLLGQHISVDGAGIIAEASVMAINFALEFMWQKFVVFRKPKDKKAAPAKQDQNTAE